MNTLQRIIFPAKEICNINEMFFRSNEEIYVLDSKKLIFNLPDIIGKKITFDTYFNVFSLSKWRKYSKIENLFFNFRFKGEIKIKFYSVELLGDGINKENIYEKIFNSITDKLEKIEIYFNDINRKSDIYLEIIPYKEGTEIYEMEFSTEIEEKKLNNIKLGVGTCTYFKENYIYKNFNLLDRIIKSNIETDKISYYIVDNGNSINKNKIEHIKNLKVIYSKNMGASGGFSRVFYESIQGNDTHIITLDDDILINPYSVVLLYNFLIFMKNEFLDYGIGGAMLIYDRKYMQHDSGAYLEENKILPINQNLDLRKFN